MTEIRRAFLSASVGRYLVMTVNLAAAAVMARLLTHAVDDKGNRLIWLPHDAIAKLKAMRGPGESYSDVILRPAGRHWRSREVRIQWIVSCGPTNDRPSV